MNYSKIICFVICGLMIVGCKITNITNPKTVQTNTNITFTLSIEDYDVPEKNNPFGIVGILIPDSWTFSNADYSFELGNGTFNISSEWADSIEAEYPAEDFEVGYHWIALKSDNSYSYRDPIHIEVNINLITGDIEGPHNLAFIVTKALPNYISQGQYDYAPIIYPVSVSVSDSGEIFEPPFNITQNIEWDNLLDNDSGWTGSDGIYSIPYNENELPDNDSKHLLVFSDTFIGSVDDDGKRVNSQMINNSYSIIESIYPNSANIEFYWDTTGTEPNSVFVPNTPNSKEDEWYWFMDGIRIDSIFYSYVMRLEPYDDPYFPFNIMGVSLIKYKINEQNDIINPIQIETPFYYKQDGKDVLFGQAVMPLTGNSMNYSQNGYIYIYGPNTLSNGRHLACARVSPSEIENFSSYTFWDGTSWSYNIEDSAPIVNGISQEFSVTPLEDGNFILVFQIGDYVAYRIGESPIGPFKMFNIIYDCPEVSISENVFVYNAKAHPSLSVNDDLLISYNVNTFDFVENLNNADIYRPRFINLILNDFYLIPSINYNLKTFLEGNYSISQSMNTSLNDLNMVPLSQPFNMLPWNYSGNESVVSIPENVVDWILVELRDKENNTIIIKRRAAFIKSDGTITDLDGTSPLNFSVPLDNYFVKIIHRNHLSIMSKLPVPLD